MREGYHTKGVAMRLILAVLFTGMAAAFVCAQTTQPKGKEPPKAAVVDALKIAGKTFDQWLNELTFGHPSYAKDPSKRVTAIQAICAFPAPTAVNAIPKLLGELKRHSGNTPVDLSVRCNLCLALGQLVGSGEKFDPKWKGETVTLLTNQLNDQQAILRLRALAALEAIGPEARSAIPAVINYGIRDRVTWEVRCAAASTLGAISHEGSAGPSTLVLKSLSDLLGDSAYQVRLAAVHSLSTLGPRPDELQNYVAALLPIALKDPEPGLQIWARIAIIGATNDFAPKYIDGIAEFTGNVDPGIRMQAVQALGTIGDKAKSKIPMLIERLRDADLGVQVSAMWALGRMEAYAINAVGPLEKIAADPNLPDHIKRSAKDAVDKIKPK
jgi:HEAT repeat protein